MKKKTKKINSKIIRCDISKCPIFIGLFLQGQIMSGFSKEELHKKLLKLFKDGGGGILDLGHQIS